MACGCGGGGQAGEAAQQWQVTPADGSGVKKFESKPDADVYAARTGGIVRKVA